MLQLQSAHDAYVSQSVRGYVAHQGSGGAALVVHSGGVTTILKLDELKNESTSDKRRQSPKMNAVRSKASELAKAQGVEPASPPDNSSDYTITFENLIRPGAPVQTTIFLLVDRLPGNDESAALLTVDSVDFEISPTSTKAQ